MQETALVETRFPRLIQQATTTDGQVISMWLHGRPPTTQRAYQVDAARLLQFVGKPLQEITLGDLQDFADHLVALAPATQARKLAAVKSLLSFGHRLGYLRFDVGR